MTRGPLSGSAALASEPVSVAPPSAVRAGADAELDELTWGDESGEVLKADAGNKAGGVDKPAEPSATPKPELTTQPATEPSEPEDEPLVESLAHGVAGGFFSTAPPMSHEDEDYTSLEGLRLSDPSLEPPSPEQLARRQRFRGLVFRIVIGASALLILAACVTLLQR